MVLDPNTIFADIDNIRRAQEEAGRFDSKSSKSESEEEDIVDEIVIAR